MRFLKQNLPVLVFLLTLGAIMAFSQVIPTGKLVGTVTDDEGLELPGASVTISSPSLILPQMSTVSNEKGYYRLIELPSGKYQVKVKMPAMKTTIREGIIVTAGRTVTLDIVMEQSAIEEEVTVIGKAPIIDLQGTTTGVNLGTEFIDNLPVARNFEGLYNMAPGLYDSTSHGSDVRSNKYTIDGVVSKEIRGGVTGVQASFNSIEEVIVDTGGHKAEYGSVRGAVIQVLTKSGGNTLSGEVNLYTKLNSLQSDNTKGTPFEGQFVGFDYEYAPGFSVGGPIKRDKIWFFAAFNMQKEQSYIEGYPFGADQNEPINKDYFAPFLKMTWQLNPTHKIVASSWFRGDYTDHHYANRFYTLDATAKLRDKWYLQSLQWTGNFSSNLLMTLRGGYYRKIYKVIPNVDKQWTIHLPSNQVTSRGELGNQWDFRYQVNSTVTYFVDDWMGSHEFKIGGDFEFGGTHTQNIKRPELQFQGLFEDGFKLYRYWTKNGIPWQMQVSQDIDQFENSLILGLFIQDTWSPSKNLVLNLGLRYDLTQGIYPKQINPRTGEYAYEKRTVDVNWSSIAPRLGLSYDPFRDGKTVFKVGYGRYYAPLNMHAFRYASKNMARQFFIRLNPDGSEAYRYNYRGGGAITWDPDSKPGYGDEINFAIHRELVTDLSLSVTYIQKWEKNLIERMDQNAIDVDLLGQTGEIKWMHYTIAAGTDPETGQPVEFYNQMPDKPDVVYFHTNVPGTARKYRGLEIKLTKRMSNNWAMLASYVYGRSEGIISTSFKDTWTTSMLYVDPNFTMFYRNGLLENQREHYLKIQGTYVAPLGFLISCNFQYFTGAPFTRQIRSLEAGVTLLQGVVTRNAEPRGSSKLPDDYLLDLRVEKRLNIRPGSLHLMLDIFNIFNSNEITAYGTVTGRDYMTPTAITSPRYVRLGIAYRF